MSEGALLGLARSIHWHISSTRPRAVHLAYNRAVHLAYDRAVHS